MKTTHDNGADRLVAGRFEAVLLLLLGGMLLFFSNSDLYQTLLNPKFSLLSSATGSGLLVLGIVLLRWPVAFDPVRAGAFVCVIALFALVIAKPIDHSIGRSTAAESAGLIDAERTYSSRVEKDGRSYVRINLGELYDIAEVGTDQQRQQRYLVRGILVESPTTKQGRSVLLRTAISCCFADAVAVGFNIVSDDKPLPYGQWVNLYAVLEPWSRKKEEQDEPTLQGVSFTSIHSSFRLRAEIIEKINPPEVSFMFEFHSEEPYAF